MGKRGRKPKKQITASDGNSASPIIDNSDANTEKKYSVQNADKVLPDPPPLLLAGKITSYFPKSPESKPSVKPAQMNTVSKAPLPPTGLLTPDNTPVKDLTQAGHDRRKSPPHQDTTSPDSRAKLSLKYDGEVAGSAEAKREERKKTNRRRKPRQVKTPVQPPTTTLKDYFPVRRSNRRCKSEIKAEEAKLLEAAVLSGREEGLEIRDILGKGRGIVATRAFRKGDFVVEYHGRHIDIKTAKDRELEYAASPEIGCYMYYYQYRNKSFCVDATKESGRIGRLLNHSKAGNCATKLISIRSAPYLILVAGQDISAGEELVYDYGDRNKESLESHPWLAL